MVGVPSLAEDVAPSYRISLRRSGEGPGATWLAEVDELPDCSARGATPEEALRRVWAAASGQRGEAPEGERDAPQTTSARHSGRLLVRMPATLHDELARAAESEGVSLNQLITGVLAAAVEWRTSDKPAGERRRAQGKRGDGAATGTGSRRLSGRVTRVALAANFAVVLIAAIAAIALLIAAWQNW